MNEGVHFEEAEIRSTRTEPYQSGCGRLKLGQGVVAEVAGAATFSSLEPLGPLSHVEAEHEDGYGAADHYFGPMPQDA